MRITGNGLRITGGLTLGNLLPIMRWNPTYLDGPVVLENNNTSYIDFFAGNYSIIATTVIPASGLYVYTVRMAYNYDADVPDIGGYVGVANTSFNAVNSLGIDANSIGFSDNGLLWYDTAGGPPIDGGYPYFNVNATRIIDVAILDRTYLWYRVDGGDWNGNASSDLSTGTGGVDISSYNFGEIYPAVTVAGDVGPTRFDILRTSPYSLPVGATNLNMYTSTPAPSGPPYTAVQAAPNDGANAPCIADIYSWASSVPVGATIVAEGFGTYTVTTISTPGTYGPNWRFDVDPNTSLFPVGTNFTFNW